VRAAIGFGWAAAAVVGVTTLAACGVRERAVAALPEGAAAPAGGGAAAGAGAAGGGWPEAVLPADPADYAPFPGLPAMSVPAENPITAEKAELGRLLYHDRRLSGDGKLACYSCHLNEKGLTDGIAKGKGAFGKDLTRSAPTLWNVGFQPHWYWDGRAKTLEAQALAAWKLANMGAKDQEKDEVRADILAALNAVPAYQERFQEAFGGPATQERVVQALATYMRTIVSRDTAWDRFTAGDAGALSADAQAGWKLFQEKGCVTCHTPPLFTDMQFHNVGIGMSAEKPDQGRGAITKNEAESGAFKTPTLRDVARSAPYFHDGSAATLEEAVKAMLSGGFDNPHLDRERLKRQSITHDEFERILAFLREGLTERTVMPRPEVP
jgi:cytochrome c peroxidase